MQRVLLDNFFAGLAQAECQIDLDSNASRDEAGDGGVSRASFGTRMWQGKINLIPATQADMSAIQAKINYLKSADVMFRMAVDWRADRTVTSGAVTAINPNDRRLATLSKAIAPGEFFGVAFEDKLSLHHVAFVDGLIHGFSPPLPFSIDDGDAVTFGQNQIDAIWTEGTAPTYRPVLAEGLSFSWQQVY